MSAKALLISREDFIRNTLVSGNIDFDKVIQYIEIAQDIFIQELIGTRLYDKIQADILGDTLSGDYEILVKKYIKPTLTQYSLLEFLPFSLYTIGNKGVFKHTSEASNAIDQEDYKRLLESTRDTAQHYAKRLVEHIKAYPTKYPEYFTNNRDEVRPNRDVTFGGWHI